MTALEPETVTVDETQTVEGVASTTTLTITAPAPSVTVTETQFVEAATPLSTDLSTADAPLSTATKTSYSTLPAPRSTVQEEAATPFSTSTSTKTEYSTVPATTTTSTAYSRPTVCALKPPLVSFAATQVPRRLSSRRGLTLPLHLQSIKCPVPALRTADQVVQIALIKVRFRFDTVLPPLGSELTCLLARGRRRSSYRAAGPFRSTAARRACGATPSVCRNAERSQVSRPPFSVRLASCVCPNWCHIASPLELSYCHVTESVSQSACGLGSFATISRRSSRETCGLERVKDREDGSSAIKGRRAPVRAAHRRRGRRDAVGAFDPRTEDEQREVSPSEWAVQQPASERASVAAVECTGCESLVGIVLELARVDQNLCRLQLCPRVRLEEVDEAGRAANAVAHRSDSIGQSRARSAAALPLKVVALAFLPSPPVHPPLPL